MKNQNFLFVIVIVVVLSIFCINKHFVDASSGDESPRYRRCVSLCLRRDCQKLLGQFRPSGSSQYVEKRTGRQGRKSFWMKNVLQWGCEDECRYQCQREDVKQRENIGEAQVQYHGKWGFQRVFGFQEIFSVIFSIGNALPHIYYIVRLTIGESKRSTLHSPSVFATTSTSLSSGVSPLNLKFNLISFGVVGINAWFWSAVFHARDTLITERLDYFSAFFLVIWSVWLALVRTLEITSPLKQYSILASLVAFFLVHVSYLHFVHFDYGYNLAVNVLFGVGASLLWLRWIFNNRHRRYTKKLLLSIVGVYPFILLEVFDFPPIFYLIDAHALWHAATIPFCILLYQSLIEDINYEKNQNKIA